MKKKNLAVRISIIIAILAFVIFTPISTRFWYQVGSGNSFLTLLQEGLSREEAIPIAKRDGAVFAFFMINGAHLPLLCLVLVTIGIIRRLDSKKKRRYLRIAFFLVCLWGLIFLGLSHRMILKLSGLSSDPFPSFFAGAFGIWIIIAICFGIIILFASLIRRFIVKTRATSKNK